MGEETIMNRIKTLGVLVLGSLFFASCANKTGDVQEAAGQSNLPVTISKLEMAASGSGSQLVVHSNKEPKYNVFKLMDPERIVVDVIDAKLGDDVPSSLPGNEMVKEVKVQALEDSLSALVRMEIVLNTSANYLAEVTSDGMVLRLVNTGAENAEAPKESTAPAVESPVPMAAVESPMPAPSEAPAAPVVEAPPPVAMPEVAMAPVPVPVAPMPSASPEATPEPLKVKPQTVD